MNPLQTNTRIHSGPIQRQVARRSRILEMKIMYLRVTADPSETTENLSHSALFPKKRESESFFSAAIAFEAQARPELEWLPLYNYITFGYAVASFAHWWNQKWRPRGRINHAGRQCFRRENNG